MKSILKKIGADRFLILALAGIALMGMQFTTRNIAINSNKTKEKTPIKYDDPEPDCVEGDAESQTIHNGSYEKEIESELTRLIQNIQGAGKAVVMVMTNGSEQKIVEKDTPYNRENETSSDKNGSEQITKMENEETTVYVEKADGTRAPFVSKQYAPVITGVVVACEGGDDEDVAGEITEVCQALFDLDAHTIKVVKIKE